MEKPLRKIILIVLFLIHVSIFARLMLSACVKIQSSESFKP